MKTKKKNKYFYGGNGDFDKLDKVYDEIKIIRKTNYGNLLTLNIKIKELGNLSNTIINSNKHNCEYLKYLIANAIQHLKKSNENYKKSILNTKTGNTDSYRIYDVNQKFKNFREIFEKYLLYNKFYSRISSNNQELKPYGDGETLKKLFDQEKELGKSDKGDNSSKSQNLVTIRSKLLDKVNESYKRFIQNCNNTTTNNIIYNNSSNSNIEKLTKLIIPFLKNGNKYIPINSFSDTKFINSLINKPDPLFIKDNDNIRLNTFSENNKSEIRTINTCNSNNENFNTQDCYIDNQFLLKTFPTYYENVDVVEPKNKSLLKGDAKLVKLLLYPKIGHGLREEDIKVYTFIGNTRINEQLWKQNYDTDKWEIVGNKVSCNDDFKSSETSQAEENLIKRYKSSNEGPNNTIWELFGGFKNKKTKNKKRKKPKNKTKTKTKTKIK